MSVEAGEAADAMDDEALVATLRVGAAEVAVVTRQRPLDVAKRERRLATARRGSSSTWNCSVRPPQLFTSATPSTVRSPGARV